MIGLFGGSVLLVSCTVRVRTLAFPVHSGVFGGAAPDALVALINLQTASRHGAHRR
jgi:hypothetical protein